jgi:23S rRNA (pseudouridine1915-N3)-methyltransferase
MRIHLISVARRVPPWVRAAYEDYAGRLPARCALGLIEVTAERRWRGRDRQRPLKREGERVLKAIPEGGVVLLHDYFPGLRP